MQFLFQYCFDYATQCYCCQMEFLMQASVNRFEGPLNYIPKEGQTAMHLFMHPFEYFVPYLSIVVEPFCVKEV